MQTSLALINTSAAHATPPTENDGSLNPPYDHPALQGLDGLTSHKRLEALSQQRIAKLGQRYGLDSVLRWKPKSVSHSLYTKPMVVC